MKDAFEKLMRESDKAAPVPESIAKYAAALVAGTHEITSLTIQPKRQWVGLTDEDKEELQDSWVSDQSGEPICYWPDDLIEAIEAKLKEKNT